MAVGGVKPVAQLAAIVADENREAAVEADEQQRQLAGFGCWLNALGAVQRRSVFPQHPGQGGAAQLRPWGRRGSLPSI